MYGKHSLTASVVAIGGPNGPRYYPEAFSPAGAEAFADSSRTAGIPAVVVPVDLRMPDPGELLKMPRPQLWSVAKTDSFDVLEQRDSETAGDEPRGSSESIVPTVEADGTAERMERIHDTIGRLALLEYSAEHAKDDEQRLRIFREMHAAALPLAGDIEPLLEADDEGRVELPSDIEDELHEPFEGNAIARGFALRILDHPEVGSGWWVKRLISPSMNVRKLVSNLAEKGTKARAYDVSVDLDMGAVTVKPLPWWTSPANAPEHVGEEREDSGTAPADGRTENSETERLGDESSYLGTAEFERLPNRWTVWTLEVHPAARPELQASFRTFKKALKNAEKINAAPGYEIAAIVLGPGHGSVRVDNITLWPNAWVVRTITDEEVYPDGAILCQNGDPITREPAIRYAEGIAKTDSYGRPACPIVFLPYRPEPKGGVR